MLPDILMLLHGAVLLSFGITLSAAFAGIRFTRQNALIFLGMFLFSGVLQLTAKVFLSEDMVWKLYPPITHLPLILLLCIYYRKTAATAMAAAFTAYFCCQPAKWVGVTLLLTTHSQCWEHVGRILCLILVGCFAWHYLAPCLSEIFNKDTRSVCIFGIVPTIYYFFDYATVVYTDLWARSNRIVVEFLPFLLFMVYMLFCIVYYREYEQKADAERKEQMIRITTQQQAREFASMEHNQQEIRLMRHDMRLFLGNLSVALEDGDLEYAKKMVAAYTDSVDKATVRRFCENNTVNYVLSHFAARCEGSKISFQADVAIDKELPDELFFSSILSNALDNALNAQLELPEKKRKIKVLLKNSDNRLLLSVKNPFRKAPQFADGLPVSARKGHGYGTQSIRYLTDRLGGNCQFSIQNDLFVVRVIL